MNIVLTMLRCLLLTILFENGLAFILGVRTKFDQLIVMLVQVMTNPLVVSTSIMINIFYGIKAKNISMIFLELFAVISEGLVYYKVLDYKKINGFALALILNIFSYSIGEIINIFI